MKVSDYMIEQKVIQRIRELLKFKHWTPYKLAKQAGLPYSSLNNIFNRKSCPSIATLERICNGFGIGLSEFFQFEKNPLRDESITLEQQDLLNSYDSLSKQDKQLLQAYLKGLLRK